MSQFDRFQDALDCRAELIGPGYKEGYLLGMLQCLVEIWGDEKALQVIKDSIIELERHNRIDGTLREEDYMPAITQ